MKQVRNVMFVVLVGLAVFAHEKGLLANISNLCGNWAGYCSCNATNNYQWTISCDFSSSDDPLGVAMEFCQDAQNTCDAACNSTEFVDAAIAECFWTSPYPELCVRDCFIPYAAPNYCAFGEQSSAECACRALNWCLP